MTAMRLHRYPSPSGGVALGKVGCTDLFHRITAKSYIQDGLIAMWDGIENAGWGVHDASAIVWYDLSGNNETITLRSGTYWGDDCLRQDTAHGSFGSFSRPLQYLHAEGVIRSDGEPDVDTANGRVCLVSFYNYAPYDYQIGYRGTWLTFGNYAGTAPCISLDNPHDILAFSFAIGVAESNPPTVAAYRNGELSEGRYYAYYGASGTGLGGRAGNNRAMSGRIHNLRFYNRNLTADEIARNYAIDKARFNLS